MCPMITVDVDAHYGWDQGASNQWWSDEPDDHRGRGRTLRVGSGCFTLQSIRALLTALLTRSLDHQDLG